MLEYIPGKVPDCFMNYLTELFDLNQAMFTN